MEFSEADGLIFTKNESEYPKTEGAIPSGRSNRCATKAMLRSSTELVFDMSSGGGDW